eukprot:TRINITY_DN6143_c1_g1_i1.p1 TRINITY_DN6143_c1_g1~~TRINITY_DN6143_c1_g1_i1.p1  ORF type:complete len:764 (-),score=125.90 TRINITY_DN6143_c1_g1_i1:103-2394(-)
MKGWILFSVVVGISQLVCGYSVPPPLNYVNVYIGTGGEGYGIGSMFPGATTPFGMVRLSPDTTGADGIFITFDHYGGYYYNDYYVRLFSHTHMVGSGVLDYGTIGVMPIAAQPTGQIISDFGFKDKFNHEYENAFPGYYSVLLLTSEIFVELTATTHVGIHRYTFTKPNSPINVLFPVSYTLTPDACTKSSVFINLTQNANEVSGWVMNEGSLSNRFGGVMTYFVALFPQNFKTFGVWNDGKVFNNERVANGTNIGAFVGFGNVGSSGNVTIEFKVGISFISVDQARVNLYAEAPGSVNFDTVLKQTQQSWVNLLSLVEVDPATTSQDNLVKFYSALYHTYQAPTTFSEVGGYYLGFDSKVHVVNESHLYYTDMSIWDDFRTEYPWLALTQPLVMTDIVRSLLLMYQQGGDLPRWPLANGYTGCMIGEHADIVIADAYFKGLTNFDVQLAYKAVRQSATTQQVHASRVDIQDWINLGYISYEKDGHAVCDTLSYSVDDWAVGNLAQALGYLNDSALFLNRSKNYRNVWNEQEQFFCPRDSNGKWECPLVKINVWDERYVEGDAWHYRWYVLHDTPGLVDLFGGKDNFITQLTEFLQLSEDDPLNVLPNPYYWAGNEEDILAPYQFVYGDRPDLTQKYVRYLIDNKFTTEPSGLPGNSDYGCMDAWLVFSMLGFYPLPGDPSGTYIIGSPLVGNATIHIPPQSATSQTNDLQIIAYNQGVENVYVEKVTLDGKILPTPFVTHSQLLSASKFEFWMTNAPPAQNL